MDEFGYEPLANDIVDADTGGPYENFTALSWEEYDAALRAGGRQEAARRHRLARALQGRDPSDRG